MNTKETSTREQANKWFASKTYLEQHELSDKYFESRNPSLLTIEQVKEIWIKENKIDEDLEIWYNVHKPNQKQYSQEEVDELLDRQAAEVTHQTIKVMKALNQKQFKTFDESLFKSYIDKMPESESLNMIKIIYKTKLPDCKFKEHLNKWFKL